MKALLIVFSAAAVVMAIGDFPCAADTCVRIKSHTDEYYYGGEVNPALDRTTDARFSHAVRPLRRGFGVSSSEKIVEAAEMTPPPGLYEIPAGFHRKSELTLQDIHG